MSIPCTLDGELQRRKLRRNYSDYCAYVNKGFYMSHFHKWLCDKVQEFVETPCTNGTMDILLLSVPPQHGKSTTVTETLPSWFLGKHPEDAVIIAGYEGTFAEGFSRRNRDKFNEYAEDIFGVKPNPNVQGVALWETEDGGKCRAAGLKAGITGYPAELFIIDDPIKNREQAQSETMLAKIHDEMAPSVQTRIHPGGKLIVIQTRWVENDVIGWVQEHWADYIWADINIPCECEDAATDPLGRQPGQAIMGEHMGDIDLPQKIRKDNKWLKGAKMMVTAADGEYTWNALYQGHPSAENGNLFMRDSWQYYRLGDIAAPWDYLQLSVDATFKQTETSDKVAMELWGVRDNDAWLIKLVNKRMGFKATCDKIRDLVQEYPDIDELIIEDKANGPAIIETLQYIDSMPPIVGVNPKGGKYSRAQAVSPFVTARRCHLRTDWAPDELRDIEPSGKTVLAPEQEFVEQMARFPYAKNDDMVDSCSQGLTRIIKLLTGDEPMPQHRTLRKTYWYPDMWEDFMQMDALQQQRFIQLYGEPLNEYEGDYDY